jgi:hypothetical protein
MARDRTAVLLWAVALGSVTGLIVGTVVPTPAGLSSLQFSLGVTALAGPVLGVLLWTRWDDWATLGPWIGIAIYFSALFVGTVVLSGFARVIVGIPAWLSVGLQLLGSASAVAVAVWLCFYGGAGTTLHWLVPRLGIEI